MFQRFYKIFNYSTIAIVIVILILILTETVSKDMYVPLVVITFIILIPFSFSYLISPLNDDTRIYQGVASLTDYFGSFPANINNAWEIKPIANRGINYILYKISTLFTTVTTPEYEIVIKLLSLIIVLFLIPQSFHVASVSEVGTRTSFPLRSKRKR